MGVHCWQELSLDITSLHLSYFVKALLVKEIQIVLRANLHSLTVYDDVTLKTQIRM